MLKKDVHLEEFENQHHTEVQVKKGLIAMTTISTVSFIAYIFTVIFYFL